MKFVWFNLMPWPDLPDDFRESHRSVWVDIDPCAEHWDVQPWIGLDITEYCSLVAP